MKSINTSNILNTKSCISSPEIKISIPQQLKIINNKYFKIINKLNVLKINNKTF